MNLARDLLLQIAFSETADGTPASRGEFQVKENRSETFRVHKEN